MDTHLSLSIEVKTNASNDIDFLYNLFRCFDRLGRYSTSLG